MESGAGDDKAGRQLTLYLSGQSVCSEKDKWVGLRNVESVDGTSAQSQNHKRAIGQETIRILIAGGKPRFRCSNVRRVSRFDGR